MSSFRLIFLLFCFVISCCDSVFCSFDVNVASRAAILINADTGRILYQKEARVPRYPASVTKMATGLYALSRLHGEDVWEHSIIADQDSIGAISEVEKKKSKYTLPAYWLEFGSSHMGIKNKEKLSLKTLMYGMLIASANDASNCIAKYISGSVPNFVSEMNEYLKNLDCQNTNFCNPHGLHHPDHKTTPYDLALIARAALLIPAFRTIVRTPKYLRSKTNKQEETWLLNTNKMVHAKNAHYYPDAIGIKTGYHSYANFNLVAAAEKGGRTLIAVVMDCKNRGGTFKDAAALFDAAYGESKVSCRLVHRGPQDLHLSLKGAREPLNIMTTEDVTLEYYPSEKPKKTAAKVYWDELTLPIERGQYVGDLHVLIEDKTYSVIPLYAQNAVQKTWRQRTADLFGGIFR